MLKAKSYVLVSVFIGILLIAPTIISTFDDNALIRFKGTSLIGNSPAYFEKVSERYSWDKENNNIIGYIYDNRKTASVLLISNAYLSHFNPTWLFFNESEDAFKAPNIGLLYLFELPLILFALILILRSKISSKSLTFIFLWAAVAVIPASITTGYPHAMRAYGVLPVPQILAAVGVISILLVLKNKKWQYAFVSIFGIVVLVSAVWFFNSYFNLLPKEISNHFQYGVINALKEAKSIEGNYDRVVVSNKDNLFESYMFYLYLNKLDPKAYQEAGGTISGGFEEEHEIGKYVFGSVKDKLGENTLYVLNPHEFQDLEINKISTINNLKGEPVLIIAESK